MRPMSHEAWEAAAQVVGRNVPSLFMASFQGLVPMRSRAHVPAKKSGHIEP